MTVKHFCEKAGLSGYFQWCALLQENRRNSNTSDVLNKSIKAQIQDICKELKSTDDEHCEV